TDGNDLTSASRNLAEGYYVGNSSQTVGITPAVKAVEFTANGVEGVVGTTAIEAKSLFAVNTGMFVSIDGGILQPISSTEVTLFPVVNKGTQKTQVTVNGEGQENGYYIPSVITTIPAVEIKRAYPFGTTTESYTDKTDTGYVYYFAVNPVFPASFLKPENVTVKSKEGTAGNVVKFCLAKDGGTPFIAEWLDKLVGNFETYAIGFTLPSESSEVTFQFVTENENGFCISELPSKL
ncbi:hypothetical protein, partial [Treponema endosymbiont of Eucomonympha sp.]|uniref:hypothetical protein n=1 Tax=Treponema endosymbiont of Eucomonympha sp. TaxID=1580831 RepID=UPI000A7871FE